MVLFLYPLLNDSGEISPGYAAKFGGNALRHFPVRREYRSVAFLNRYRSYITRRAFLDAIYAQGRTI